MAKLGILIVGGGIAGLSAAAALRQRGFGVELVERDNHWSPVGGGIAVQPNAMRVLRALGIDAAVAQDGAIVRRWLFRDQEGDVLCDIQLEPLWRDVGPFIGIERSKLHDALRFAGGACRLRTWTTALNQDGGRVSVAFNGGGVGEYDLVIGGDGIHSTVRGLALGGTPPIYGGQMVWRSVAPIHASETDSVEFWLGEGCFFGLCPVGGGRTYGFANVTQARVHDPLEGRLERLRRCFAGFGRPIRHYLDSLEGDEQIHCGPIEWLEGALWHRGRVILIGDAAHASSPMMGQGGSMAMEDGIVLAELLHSFGNLRQALEAFVARRKPRVDWVRQQSRAVADMLGRPSRVRNAALRERGKQAFYQRFEPLVAAP